MPNDLLDCLERARQKREAPEQQTDPIDAVQQQIRREATDLRPIKLPWPRLSSLSKFLKPGTLAVLGGSPGAGKSFLALAIGLACQSADVGWSYLPLESDRAFFLRRLAAMLDRSFDALLDTEDDPNAEERASAAVDRVRGELQTMARCIFENPTLPSATGEARTVTPEYVLEWLESQFSNGRRVCIFDPLAMIDFAQGRDQWRSENSFIQSLVSLAYRTGGTVCMVAHLIKRVESRLVEVGDLQGGASIGRLAASVILVQKHATKESEVFRHSQLTAPVEHNRTLVLAKSRNSADSLPLAFEFGENGPNYKELGVICPKK